MLSGIGMCTLQKFYRYNTDSGLCISIWYFMKSCKILDCACLGSNKACTINYVTAPLKSSIHESKSKKPCHLNTLRPKQNGCNFTDNILKCIFLNENMWISICISLKFVPKVRINNITALVQIMAWRRLGDKPLSESMVVSLLMHICVTQPE